MEDYLPNVALSFARVTALLNAETDDWAIAMHITGSPAADSIMNELKRLIPQTIGRSITIVVQITADKTDMAFPGRRNPHSIEKQLYVLRRGQLKQLAPGFSDGYRRDLENLLSFTTTNFKSRKIGLLINSHGGGNWGLAADTGTLTKAELAKTVSKGLKDSNHESLDLLDFEDSLMGKNGVYHEAACAMRSIFAGSQHPQWSNGSDLIDRIKQVLDELLASSSSARRRNTCDDVSCIPLASPA